MTTTDTADVEATTAQIKRLEAHGCDIIRVAVPNIEAADAISKIKENINIPLVADIHFDHKLALRAIEAGADKIRINPGNIGKTDSKGNNAKVKQVAEACNRKKIPIRIGVNGGSLEKEILAKHGDITPAAMVESALGHIALLNKYDFDNIWISAKTSNVPLTVKTYRLLSQQTKYPLHIGITEAGTEYNGIIKNAIGIGTLLLDGIGNTIRVSLTAEPEREVIAAKAILKSIGLRPGLDIISCPTCGRCNIDLMGMVNEVEKKLTDGSILSDKAWYDKNITVAIMGCSVNGPGEASHADFGIAAYGGGRNVGVADYGIAGCTKASKVGVLFAKGKVVNKVPIKKLTDELVKLILKEVTK